MKEIPYIVFESEMTRLERIIKKQFVLIIITVLFLVGTNACWLWYESQFEEVTTTEVTQDLDSGEGGDAIINDGVRINGESKTNSQDD
jgi:hypothetical protein